MKNVSRVLWCCGIVAMVLAFQTSLATAAALGNDITINGFGHQSAIQTDTNEFVVPGSSEGSFQDYVVGLTFSSEVNDRVSVRTQILSTQTSFYVDWGFAEYRFNESVGFKFGKVKLPLGLYTEIADVKNLQPFSYLPTLIYNHGMTSYNGIGVYGMTDFNNGWGGEVELFGGGSEMKGGKHAEPVPMKNFVGGRVTLNTPLPGARLMFSAMRSDLEMDMGMMTMEVESEVFLVSGEVIGDRFFVRSEAASFKNVEDNKSWYAEAGFLVHDNVQPVVRYIHQRKENTPSLTLAARNLIGQTDKQNEIGIGLNVFLTSAVVLKVEHHFVDGSSELNREVLTNDAPDNSWNLTAVSVAFAF